MPAPPGRFIRKDNRMSQMTIDDRKRIDFLLNGGYTAAEIAGELGRSKATVLREIINRSVECSRGRGCSNRLCANYGACDLRVFSAGSSRSLRKNARKCFEDCPEFAEAACPRLETKSHVCNGCREFANCPLMKRIYVAEGAQANRESLLRDSRAGIHPSGDDVSRMNGVLSPCIFRGQSVRNVIVNNPGVFRGVSGRSVYDYIAGGLFDAKRGDLPEACARRPRKKRRTTKADARRRVGRTYANFIEYCRVNGVTEWTELDTVIGRTGGKLLFTMFLPGGLMIAFLRDRKTPGTCTRLFNMLWSVAGPDLFRKLFSVILTDNGGEFSDPEAVENFRPDAEHNPAKLLPRGIRLFYCDPYCSSQKPHVEREHREERRILTHGVPFDTLDQDDINLVCSHVASYTRPALANATPYDSFAAKFGEAGRAFLDRLGIVRIPGNEVTLDPILLGTKFKRRADEAILRRNGVVPAGTNGSGK